MAAYLELRSFYKTDARRRFTKQPLAPCGIKHPPLKPEYVVISRSSKVSEARLRPRTLRGVLLVLLGGVSFYLLVPRPKFLVPHTLALSDPLALRGVSVLKAPGA